MKARTFLAALVGAVTLAISVPLAAFAGLTATTLTLTIPATVSLSGYGASSFSATGAAGVQTQFATGVQTVTGNDSNGYNVQTNAGAASWVATGNSFTLAAGSTTFNSNTCSTGITCNAGTPVAITTTMQTTVSKASAPASSGDTFTINYAVTPPAGQGSGAYSLTVNEVLNAL